MHRTVQAMLRSGPEPVLSALSPVLGQQPHDDEIVETALAEDGLALPSFLLEAEPSIQRKRHRIAGHGDQAEPVQSALLEQVPHDVAEQLATIALPAQRAHDVRPDIGVAVDWI